MRERPPPWTCYAGCGPGGRQKPRHCASSEGDLVERHRGERIVATDRARHQGIDGAPAVLAAQCPAQIMLGAAEIVALVKLRNRVVDVVIKPDTRQEYRRLNYRVRLPGPTGL